uniref:Putative secreted protein n=1 Tax=Amblyomma triste TaxID=251400 RepID=A0A023G905_AMBTT
MLAHIFGFLDTADLMVVEYVARRVRRVARSRCVMRFTRVHFTQPPDVVTAFINGARACAISELNLNNCVQLTSSAVKTCLISCINLTTLRCVNTRLLPSALLDVTATRVRNLTRLDWSLPDAPHCRRHARELLQRLRSDGTDLGLGFLQYMYVEVVAVAANSNLLRYVLKKCPSLVSVHFHERGAGNPRSRLTRVLLRAYVKRMQWNVLTCTNERVSDVRSITLPSTFQWFGESDVVEVLKADLSVYGNMTARKRPQSVRNCVTFVHPFLAQKTDGLSQLLVCIEDMGSAAHLLDMAAADESLQGLRALTLLTSRKPSGEERLAAYQTKLSSFFESFRALQELNLASFHFETFFDCCEMLAAASLHKLHCLSLPACAMRHPSQLQRLAYAPFTLRELDIRGEERLTCACAIHARSLRLATSRIVLLSMVLLSPLERLTLCDLPNVASLNFLLGCQVREMRLCNLGHWSMRNRLSLSSLRHVCAELRGLKLESRVLPQDLRFLHDLQPAPQLRRLCISTPFVQHDQRAGLLAFLRRLFPAAHTLHVHTLTSSDAFQLIWTRLEGARNDFHRKKVLWTDHRELCTTCDYTGLAKPLR